MLNKFLHAITNRSVISDNPLFVSDPNFLPATLPDGALQMRAALCLDNTTTDYYLKAYAAVMNIFPDIDDTLADPNRSYDVKDFYPEGVNSDGGRLLSSPGQSGYYLDIKPTSLPVPMTYIISYVAAGFCKLTQVETNQTIQSPIIAAADSVRTTLQVNWPAGWPFQGGIELFQTWQAGAQVVFTVEPSRFPYTAAVKALSAIPYFQNLLVQFNLAEIFQNTPSVKEQLALGLAVVASSNPAAFPAT